MYLKSNKTRSAMKRIRSTLIVSAAVLAIVGGCAVGPEYKRPDVEVPVAFKESGDWKVAEPQDGAQRGPWWEIFGDAQLRAIEEQVDISNQNLRGAEAQFRAAQAVVKASRAAGYPTVAGRAGATRSGQGNASSSQFSAGVDAGWEIDLWGRVRRIVEAGEANVQASAADLESLRLSAQGTLAQDYFQLRVADAQRQLLEETVAGYERSLQLVSNQYRAGLVAKGDVIQAEAQLKSAQAQAIDARIQRAQFEHAIALLIGKPASTFSIPQATIANAVPRIPPGVPSRLLERRPDIAAAERRMAAANAEIGAAQAAIYPALTLSASAGLQSSTLVDLFTLPSRVWSIGPALAASLFDAGLRRAQTDQAIALYDASVANYRQTVLTAFVEVEDNLVAQRLLEEEAVVQDTAVAAANQAVQIALNQYRAGTVSYLAVVTAQTTAYTNRRTALDILRRRLVASAALVMALGGGWNEVPQRP
jgi:NodT family efflux transporter outer membrane factor (OMF) lipoprotein